MVQGEALTNRTMMNNYPSRHKGCNAHTSELLIGCGLRRELARSDETRPQQRRRSRRVINTRYVVDQKIMSPAGGESVWW